MIKSNSKDQQDKYYVTEAEEEPNHVHVYSKRRNSLNESDQRPETRRKNSDNDTKNPSKPANIKQRRNSLQVPSHLPFANKPRYDPDCIICQDKFKLKLPVIKTQNEEPKPLNVYVASVKPASPLPTIAVALKPVSETTQTSNETALKSAESPKSILKVTTTTSTSPSLASSRRLSLPSIATPQTSAAEPEKLIKQNSSYKRYERRPKPIEEQEIKPTNLARRQSLQLKMTPTTIFSKSMETQTEPEEKKEVVKINPQRRVSLQYEEPILLKKLTPIEPLEKTASTQIITPPRRLSLQYEEPILLKKLTSIEPLEKPASNQTIRIDTKDKKGRKADLFAVLPNMPNVEKKPSGLFKIVPVVEPEQVHDELYIIPSIKI